MQELFYRKGTFEISSIVLYDNPEKVQAILANTLIVRCEYKAITNTFQYDAYSLMFEPVQENEKPHRYKFITNEDGTNISAEKIDYWR